MIAKTSCAVTIKGKTFGTHYSKLAMYSFQDNGVMRQDFWYWSSTDDQQYGDSKIKIGYIKQTHPYYACNKDRDQFIQMPVNFANKPITAYGRWTQNNDKLRITWEFGNWEEWYVTSDDPALYRLELAAADYLQDPCYFSPPNRRNNNVVNAGWGFGSFASFATAKPAKDCRKAFSGLYLRRNIWYTPPRDEPVAADLMALNQMPITDTEVNRNVIWDCDVGSWTFSYFGVYPGPDLLSRRVLYQISHDFGNDGHIVVEKGHTYCGLQVIDNQLQVRGLVFADCSIGANSANTVSALYYVN